MKLTLVLLALIAPTLAFAQPVTLKPGSSVVVNGDLITCESASNQQLPLCQIKQDGSYFRVYIGETIANSYYRFEEALAGVKSMKEAGLCR